ncbi:MAG: DHHA1 domain-containing protein, partial [Flavobacteriaceae bacterium]
IRFGESMELCGGTHVANTAELWHFTITAESAVASGIRRIEAVTADEAKKLVYDQAAMVDALKVQLKNPKNVLQSVQALQDDNTKLRKEIEQLNKQLVQQLISDLESSVATEKGISYLFKEVNLDAASMKDALFQLGQNRDNLVAVLASRKNNKPILSCYVSKELAQKGEINANAIIKEIGTHIQGGGGGQPFFATAGGKNPNGIANALAAAKELVLK